MPRVNTTNGSEDYISSSQVRELLEHERAHFKALLQQQELSYKNFTEIIMSTTSKRVDDLMKELQDLKTSLQYTQKEVDDLKAAQKELNNGCNSNADDIHKLAESMLVLDSKADSLETQCKQNNILIDGVPEISNEKWQDSEEKVKEIFQDKLELDYNKMIIEKVHRIGKFKSANSTRPRPIMVRFQSHKDKKQVMDKAKCLKGTKIFLNDDYPESVRQKRRELIPAMKAARDRGEIAFLRYDKLITYPSAEAKKQA